MLHLLGLAVEFSQRRRGLGAALARAALEQGEQMACGAAVLHVRAGSLVGRADTSADPGAEVSL